MKKEKLIHILGMIDEDIIIEADEDIKGVKSFRHSWVIKIIVAACFVLLVIISMNSILRSNDNIERGVSSQEVKLVIMGNKLAEYEIRISDYTKQNQLESRKGRVFAQDKDETVYCVNDRNDFVYLIFEQDGSLKLGEFCAYNINNTDEVIEKKYIGIDFGQYNYYRVLSEVFNVSSASDIKCIKFSKSDSDKTDAGLALEIPAVNSTDTETISRFYDILYDLTRINEDDWADYKFNNIDDIKNLQNEIEEKGILEVQYERMITITLVNDEEIVFLYNPVTSLLYQYGSIIYAPITQGDNEWLIELAQISFES